MAMIDNLGKPKQSNKRRLSICNSLSIIGLAAFAIVFLAVIAEILRSKKLTNSEVEKELNRVRLEAANLRDVVLQLQTRNEELTSSLSRLELTNSEVEKELNRVRLEAANLRDVVLQLQTLNEELKLTNSEVEKELNRVRLEAANLRDVVLQLQTRNEELTSSLSRLELKNSEVEKELNRVRLEAANLRDVVLQLQTVNEGLKLTNSEVEKELNRVRLEAANLQGAVLQLQTLNEGLSQDKDELNQMLMRTKAEKGVILAEKSVIEQERDGYRDELIHLKQEKMNRESEKKNAVCKVDLASYGYDDLTKCAHVRTSGGSSEEVLVRDESNRHRPLQLGVTIMELDPKTCTTRNRQSFGTHFSSRARNFFLESLQLKKEGTIIVGVTVDTPENENNAAFKKVVGSFFSDYKMDLRELKYRGKFAFIMQKGYPDKTIFRSKPPYGECLKMKLELRGSKDEDVSFRLITWS